MTTKNDDNLGRGTGKPQTMIVPGGDLDAVAAKADRKNASSGMASKPRVNNSSFDAQRIMAPGGDLDAIDLNAGILGKNERFEKPVGTTASFRPPSAGDETDMIFRDRGTFVDSEAGVSGDRNPRSDSSSVHAPDENARYMEASGFRFRDGTEDDPPHQSDSFHDRDAPRVSDPRHCAPSTREHLRSPALKNAPRQRNDAAEASGGEAVACLDVSTAQLEAVIHRIMERVFVERVETILKAVLEKAVEKEMRNFRSVLVKEMENPGGYKKDGTR